jgi:hypothetical protein
MDNPRELEWMKNYKPSINDLKNRTPDIFHSESKMENKTSDKLREFGQKVVREYGRWWGIEEKDTDKFLSDLTALISEHYYTREFLLWFHDNVQIESREETFLVYNDIRFYTLNEVRDFWQRVQEKKEYVKRKTNEQ